MTEDKKVACYVRVSTSSQAKDDKYSIPEQIDILKNICRKNNWDYDLYQDLGISGETIEARPRMIELLNNCKKGNYKKVLVVDQDRLTRNVRDLQFIKDIFIENNISLVINGNILDLSDEDDDFMSDIQGIFSKRERRLIAKRTSRGKHQKAKQGKIPTSGFNIPYGYKLDENEKIIINEEEARIVRMIFKWIAEKGMSCYKIAEKLNSLGVPTRSKSFGKILKLRVKNEICEPKWTRSSVNHITRKELYYRNEYALGNRSKYYIEPVYVDKKPIISRELFEKARSQATKNKSFHGRVSTAVYILTGKLRCKKCGYAYVGGRWHDKDGIYYYYYRDLGKKRKEYPAKCQGGSVKKELVENIIKNDIKEFLSNPNILEKYLTNLKGNRKENELADIKFQIIKNDSEMKKLIELYAEMFIPDPIQENVIKEKIKQTQEKARELQALKYGIENKEKALKVKRNEFEKISYLLKKIGEGIEKLEEWEWKRLIDKLVSKIEIDSTTSQGKTVKLDIYITYNFESIMNHKTNYYTDNVHCSSQGVINPQ